LGQNRRAAGEEVVNPCGNPLMRAGRFVCGCAIARPDRAEADYLGELADRLEQRSALGAQVAD
jgi:hypothetical protein